MNNIYGIYNDNGSARAIINNAVKKANSKFNPSFNQEVEELTNTPSDRSEYDYAGCEQEHEM